MTEEETIRQLREQNEQLRRENELLRAKICELEARLAKYENSHTPPSLRRGCKRNKENDSKGKPGQNWRGGDKQQSGKGTATTGCIKKDHWHVAQRERDLYS